MSRARATDAWGLIGTVVDGRYKIECVAGRGGHGVVYRALHLGFDIPVAVKVLRPPDCDDDDARQTLFDGFRREGRLLSQLSALHPAFVQAKEVGTLLRGDGSLVPYLVLEWLEGVGLDRELKGRRTQHKPAFALGEALGLLDTAAQGLALAHAHGISHRDLKPGNLFVVSRDGTARIKVLDLGLAKVIEPTLSTTSRFFETRRSRHSFTHAYGAPEQWASRLGASGPWTDVHAWALICVELVSGKRALSGDNSEHLMAACLDATRPTLRTLGVNTSDAVEAVFRRALAVDPRQRYRDLGAFWGALRTAAGIDHVKELPAKKLLALAPVASSANAANTNANADANANPSRSETAPSTVSGSREFGGVARNAGKLRTVHGAFSLAALVCGAAGWFALGGGASSVMSAERVAHGAPKSADSPRPSAMLTDTVPAATSKPVPATSTGAAFVSSPAPEKARTRRWSPAQPQSRHATVAPADSAPDVVVSARPAPTAVASAPPAPTVRASAPPAPAAVASASSFSTVHPVTSPGFVPFD